LKKLTVTEKIKKKVAVVTLGCKVNQFESAAIESGIVARGGELVSAGSPADVYVVNSCAVTGKAAAESRRLVRRLARTNPEARIVVTGCYAQIAVDDLLDLVDQPLCIVGNGFKHMLAMVAMSDNHCDLEMYMGDIGNTREISPLHADSFPGRTRAYLKIQDGCNSFCSYCIVPYARGRSRSVPMDEVLRQSATFAERGFRELVITGIHAGAYGRDFEPQTDLAALLRRLLEKFPELKFRISSLEPTEITEEIIDLVAAGPGLRPHFHIPLQSGDDGVLARMNRRYRAERFATVVEKIRKKVPDCAIGVDVLVGFPGEDEGAFSATCDLIESLPVTYLHVFPYSKRPGTPAANMDDQVLKRVKEERVAILKELDHKKRTRFYQSCLGQVREVLAERAKSGRLRGFTDNYIPVSFAGPRSGAGRVHRVRLERVEDMTVTGSLLPPEEDGAGGQS